MNWDAIAAISQLVTAIGATRLGRAVCVFFTALACVLLSPGLRASPLPKRPNIIFILMDDLRWDEMDYPFVTVPNIQRIARDGARFTNAFVTTPLCSPSRASILTG
jgi:Arylsulfatase A and related enzymes